MLQTEFEMHLWFEKNEIEFLNLNGISTSIVSSTHVLTPGPGHSIAVRALGPVIRPMKSRLLDIVCTNLKKWEVRVE